VGPFLLRSYTPYLHPTNPSYVYLFWLRHQKPFPSVARPEIERRIAHVAARLRALFWTTPAFVPPAVADVPELIHSAVTGRVSVVFGLWVVPPAVVAGRGSRLPPSAVLDACRLCLGCGTWFARYVVCMVLCVSRPPLAPGSSSPPSLCRVRLACVPCGWRPQWWYPNYNESMLDFWCPLGWWDQQSSIHSLMRRARPLLPPPPCRWPLVPPAEAPY